MLNLESVLSLLLIGLMIVFVNNGLVGWALSVFLDMTFLTVGDDLPLIASIFCMAILRNEPYINWSLLLAFCGRYIDLMDFNSLMRLIFCSSCIGSTSLVLDGMTATVYCDYRDLCASQLHSYCVHLLSH